MIHNVEYAKNNRLRITLQLDSIVEINSAPQNSAQDVITDNSGKTVDISLPYLHIIIADAGLNTKNTKKLFSLPTSVSIGLSPYGYNLPTLSRSFINAGYSLLMYLPMEPINYPNDDAGSYVLLRSMGAQEIKQRLEFLTTRVENILGFYSMPQENFTSSEENTYSLLEFMKTKGALFVQGQNNTNVQKIANSLKVDLVSVDLILDEELSPEGISAQLRELEEILKRKGNAMVIGRAYPLTLDMLDKWITSSNNKHILLVNINEFITKTNNYANSK
ncbi:MAG: divergent polysaccharide deacetylase family protein [Rickettsiales endosymbiont of Dermacentor nuttalli]